MTIGYTVLYLKVVNRIDFKTFSFLIFGIYTRWCMLTNLLWKSFHNICKLSHYATHSAIWQLYLKRTAKNFSPNNYRIFSSESGIFIKRDHMLVNKLSFKKHLKNSNQVLSWIHLFNENNLMSTTNNRDIWKMTKYLEINTHRRYYKILWTE